jgi:hypothetical protein
MVRAWYKDGMMKVQGVCFLFIVKFHPSVLLGILRYHLYRFFSMPALVGEDMS